MRAHEFITEFVTYDDLHKIEHRVNHLWDKDDIEVNLHQTSKKHPDGQSHFLQRANDPRNKPPITADEIEDLFVDAHKVDMTRNQIKKIPPGDEAVIADKGSNLNVPIIVNKGEDEKEIIPKTIMRKHNFKSYAPTINIPSAKNATSQFAQAFGKLRDSGLKEDETLLGSKPKSNPKYLGPTEKVKKVSPLIGNTKSKMQTPLNKKGFGGS